MKKKWIIIIIIYCLIVCMCFVFFISAICYYHHTSKLNEQIAEGKEIKTSLGNATTRPSFMRLFYQIIDSREPNILLVTACYYHNESAVNVLLENGADPNYFWQGYISPLEGAIWYDALKDQGAVIRITKNLLDHGADIDGYGSYDPVVFMAAKRLTPRFPSENDFWMQMTILYLDYGANAYEEDGTSVLHYAVGSFDSHFCEQLITKYQLNVNAIGYQQKTALIRLAAMTEAVPPREMAEVLLANGADKTLTDATGKTAYDYAVENGYTELAELLKP